MMLSLSSLFIVIAICCHCCSWTSTSDQGNERNRYDLVLNIVIVVPLCFCYLLCNRGWALLSPSLLFFPLLPAKGEDPAKGEEALLLSSLPPSPCCRLVGCCVMGGGLHPLQERCTLSLSLLFVGAIVVCHCCL